MTTEQLAKMTPEQKRAAIAEACGWKRIHIKGAGSDAMLPPEGYDKGISIRKRELLLSYGDRIEPPTGTFTAREGETMDEVFNRIGLPDYLNSLDAMHEAEKALTEEQGEAFIGALSDLSGTFAWDALAWCILDATAAQHADAFLLTVMP